MNQKTKDYSDEEKDFLDTLIMSDLLYDSVLMKLKINHEDLLYKKLVKGMLKRQIKDHLIFSIWNNLSKEQMNYLTEHINQTSLTASWMKHEDILIEFALLYPKLKEKIFDSLNDFLRKFIQKFNELAES